MDEDIAIVYSGGTDSTCVAALMAERFRRAHLLTYQEIGTRETPSPRQNIESLRAKFGSDRFPHTLYPVDSLLRHLGYDRYFSYFGRHRFFVLSTCGFSSLAWHVRTLVYCLEHGIRHAADGVTRELMHFPGHMDGVLEEFRGMYRHFGVDYANPVRDWEVPPDKQFLDQLIVDRHWDVPQVLDGLAPSRTPATQSERMRTTGWYLYEKGLMPAPDVKGSALDRSMQHGCYPFVLFNIFVFWYYLSWHGYDDYEKRMTRLFREKVEDLKPLLEEYRRLGPKSRLAGLLEEPVAAS